ncbi:BEL1-like homeodomain protein 9 isoform X2 [Sesamum indicum]|uniref:BEL1-like homeodomain protein 9 isoform X2 n=1 Tax=Sesamum indicum TaxID=4182 RepID=A0A6I9U3D5_SESIN|nr:BEL1-like homeodomain protein 9 isoform X2 [Sesamum indicum]
MAEGLESYHVPQQSRRDKLRVNNHSPACLDNLQSCCAPLLSAHDPPLISSDFNLHRQSFSLAPNTNAGVKEEGMNLMGFVGGNHHMYVDPQLGPLQLNPTSIQDISGSPCVYAAPSPHCYRGLLLDQSFHGNEVVVYKPDQTLSIPHQHPNPNSSTAATNAQSLSLSLSSHHSNNLPLELNLQRYESSMFSNNKGSRFLKPAQQLLEELCDVGRGIGIYAEKIGADSFLLDPPPMESLSGIVDDPLNFSTDGGEQTRKKSRLLSMLHEVYKRYKQYYQQMQAAVAAFESVAGLSGAAPFANLALKAMSKHFRSLKNAITDQLQFTTKSHGKINCERDETHGLESSGKSTYGERTFQSTGFIDQPVWRPQRGLPERAVTVLRAWLFEHFLHPYPTDTDKLMLAKQTGLSRNQVSNWFINARVRLWKPMVEEIHMLETRQSQKPSQREEQPPNRLNDHLPTSCSIECENASTSVQRIGEIPSKRNREDPTGTATRGNEGPMRFSYDNLLHNPWLGVGVSHTGGNGGVSLTLGLHQNGMGLSDPYPINAARRFGLESQGDGYVASGFAAQNRQFGRDINMDGQLMHDFVG